jgi:hypothetical protein
MCPRTSVLAVERLAGNPASSIDCAAVTSPVPIERALADRRLLGAALGDLASWSTWISVVKAAYGRALSERERELFAVVAGGRSPPRTVAFRTRYCGSGAVGRVPTYAG